jgi:hypothetical protein
MRIAIGTVMLVVAVLAPAGAGQNAGTPGSQDRQDRQERLRQQLEEIKRRLDLTDAQVEQIRPVLASEGEKLRAVLEKRAGGGQSRRDRRNMAKEVRAIRSDADDALKRILTKPQMAELEKLREERRDEFRKRSGGVR